MNGSKKPLVVMGQNDPAGMSLRYASQLLAQDGSPQLTAVEVNDFLDSYVEVLQDIIEQQELRELVLQQRLAQLQRQMQRQLPPDFEGSTARVLVGEPFIEIVQACLQGDHDLIIKVADGGATDYAGRKRLFGSTDLHLMRKSPVPLLIIDPDQADEPGRLLAAVDVSGTHTGELNERIVEQAALAAERLGCELHLLTVWRIPGESAMRYNPALKIDERRIGLIEEHLQTQAEERMQALARYARKLTELRCRPFIHIVKGEPQDTVPEFVDKLGVQLLVMGSVGHTRIPGLFIGTTAETILSQVNCSVMTIKPPGFISPIAYLAPETPQRVETLPRHLLRRLAAG